MGAAEILQRKIPIMGKRKKKKRKPFFKTVANPSVHDALTISSQSDKKDSAWDEVIEALRSGPEEDKDDPSSSSTKLRIIRAQRGFNAHRQSLIANSPMASEFTGLPAVA